MFSFSSNKICNWIISRIETSVLRLAAIIVLTASKTPIQQTSMIVLSHTDTCCWCHPKVTELIFLNWMKVILIHVILYHLLCYFYRSNNKRGPGFILRCFHLDLCCCSHHIHINGRSLLCSLHRHNTANTHFLQYGEFTCMGNYIPP